MRPFVTVLALLALAPPAAQAATVATEDVAECRSDSVCSRYEPPPIEVLLVFTATPGEHNDVDVAVQPDGRVLVTDRGAPLSPGAGCQGTC